MNQSDDFGKILKLWPNLVDHYKEPVVLEIDVSGVAEYLKWEERNEEPLGIWPNLYVEGVPVESVVRVFALDAGPDDEGAVSFRIGKTLSEESVF